MEFFLKLVEVGQTQIVPLFTGLITFFETPLIDHVNLLLSFVNNLSGPGFVLNLFGVSLGSLFSNVLNSIIGVFGLTLNMPTWLFVLSNIGLILILTFIMRIWDLIPVL